MELSGRGPSFGITLVAVYVAGTISSLVWDVLGGALVLGGSYARPSSSELTVVVWRLGGVFLASVVAAFVVKGILDMDSPGSVAFGTVFLGLFVGNLIGSIGLLVLSLSAGGASLGGALLLRWVAYLVSVGIIVSSRPPPAPAGGGGEYKLPPGASWSDESSFWVRRDTT